MAENLQAKPVKQIKRKGFDLLDAGYACLWFIVLQLAMELIISFSRSAIIKYRPLYYLASILVEAVFIFASLIVCSMRKVEFVESTDLNKKLDYRTALLSVAISVICVFGFSSITNVFVYSLEKLGYNSYMSNIAIPNFWYYLLYVFMMCIVPAICEEVLFRGTILKGMLKKGKTYAVFMSALIFMLMHGGPDQTIHQFILGVILGYVFVYSGSIWATILIHFLNNFYAVTSLYIMTPALQEGAETASAGPTWGELAITLVYGVCIAIFSAYLVYLCIKGIASIKKQQDKKDLQKFNLLLDKENLTEKELAWIKKYQTRAHLQEEFDDVENTLKNKKLAKKNKQTIAMQNNEQNALNGQNMISSSKTTNAGSTAYKILIGVSIAYLCLNWIFTLVTGFIL